MAEIGLSGKLFGVCVKHEGEIVGMGRSVGSGKHFFELADIAVLPEHQRRELGTRIMYSLTSWLRDNARQDAYVKLIAAEGATGFYEGYGFRVRTPEASGMSFISMQRAQSL